MTISKKKLCVPCKKYLTTVLFTANLVHSASTHDPKKRKKKKKKKKKRTMGKVVNSSYSRNGMYERLQFR